MDFWRLGLIGYPLEHSLSPQLHLAALQAVNLPGEYVLYPVRPLPPGQSELVGLLLQVWRGELSGLNVTIPHKQIVLPLLDQLTPAARAIGAVNTIWCEDGVLWGDNTDAPGFEADVRRFLGSDFGRLPYALVLGAGGAARAVVYALAQAGWAVTIAARRLEQAEALVKSLQPAVTGTLTAVSLSAHVLADKVAGMGLIVNATPVGMTPKTLASPWPGVTFAEDTAVYDLIYNPRDTRLVQDARAAGVRATTGLGMLIEQASLAFTRWTGQQVPYEVWRDAVSEN
ncbi:MAG: shikimate dehydrogenase [Ardenticatenaceae bacterium]|nr:shikimate dehydrogenase [Ardenticatenaceae bacterium]